MTQPTNSELQSQIAELRGDIQDLTKAVSGLVSFWEAGTGIFVFVRLFAKFLGYVGVIGGFFYAAWKLLRGSLGPH